jgi:hypothetical protein
MGMDLRALIHLLSASLMTIGCDLFFLTILSGQNMHFLNICRLNELEIDGKG